jgi:spore coat polysaccharide biosynthesis predicted glycosyltransferase SpsG
MKFKEEKKETTIPSNDADNVHQAIDSFLSGQSPSEIQRIKDNRHFIKEIAENPLPKEKAIMKVFGVRDVNINAILKDNIWNRSIFTTDHLCRVVFGMRYEQIRKWLAQKRKKPFEHWMLVLIIVGVAIALVIVVILMTTNFDFGKIFG